MIVEPIKGKLYKAWWSDKIGEPEDGLLLSIPSIIKGDIMVKIPNCSIVMFLGEERHDPYWEPSWYWYHRVIFKELVGWVCNARFQEI